jgi:hypothetical protein
MPPSLQQGDLFPFAAPLTVLAHCRRLEAIVLKVAPELTPEQCLRMLSELALSAQIFEHIAHTVRRSPAWIAREELPPVAPLEEPLLQHWRAVKARLPYRRS